MSDKPILDSRLIVPASLVPLNMLEMFKATIKDSDGEEQNIEFYDYDYHTNCYTFPRGNLDLIRSFGFQDIEDRRAWMPMASRDISTNLGKGLQFTKTLRPNQKQVVDEIIKEDGFGQVNAPPRFGKTVVMAFLTCYWKSRTLFLSHQVDLSTQALKTFYEFTNLLELEYNYGKQIAGIVEDWDDLDRLDVCFMPYQKFVGEAKAEYLQRFKDKFGVVLVDESHKSTADWYSQIVSTFNSKVRIGVSGTTERKDNMHVVSNYVLGPVKYKGKTEQLPCKVLSVSTGVSIPYKFGNPKMFRNMMLNYLSKDDYRNQLIINYLSSWAHAGHSIIAVTDRIDQIDKLVKQLRSMNFEAEPFHRKVFGRTKKEQDKRRKECLDRCRKGETQILIAYRTMMLGIDVPRWTAFFNLLPTANGPNYYQEYSRVRTPFENKELGYIIDFVDEHHIAKAYYGARKKEYTRENFEIEDISPISKIGGSFNNVKL